MGGLQEFPGKRTQAAYSSAQLEQELKTALLKMALVLYMIGSTLRDKVMEFIDFVKQQTHYDARSTPRNTRPWGLFI